MRVIVLLLLCCCLSLTVTADETSAKSDVRFTPAMFEENGKVFERGLFPPKRVDGVDQIVYCTGIVSRRGRIVNQLCNWGFDNRQYRSTLSQAAKKARLSPATIDGVAMVAYIKYSLRISHIDGEPKLEFFPHHFANEQYYGDDYIAAQSYSSATDLNVADSYFFGKPWIQKMVPSRCIRNSRVFLLFKVNRQGKVEDLRATDESRPKRCIDPIIEAATAGKYIPAFHEGVPVESVYIEKYYSDAAKSPNSDFSRAL